MSKSTTGVRQHFERAHPKVLRQLLKSCCWYHIGEEKHPAENCGQGLEFIVEYGWVKPFSDRLFLLEKVWNEGVALTDYYLTHPWLYRTASHFKANLRLDMLDLLHRSVIDYYGKQYHYYHNGHSNWLVFGPYSIDGDALFQACYELWQVDTRLNNQLFFKHNAA